MAPFVDVSFLGLSRDISIEVTIHQWVARLEAMGMESQHTHVTIEPSGRRRTRIAVTQLLANRTTRSSTTVHTHPHAGVADAFGALLQPRERPSRAARDRARALV